ncbi:hypothetical protein ACFW04_012624 [Cataglyphis niger]
MQRQGIKPTMTEGQIRMADGTHTATRSYVQAPLRLQGRTYTHTFAILPSLREDMLIGVDLWCQLGLNIAPPRRKIRQRQYPACGMTGGLATRTPRRASGYSRPIDRPPPAPRPPKVGTTIQRSDRKNRIKAAMLATLPPPLASCRRRHHHGN